MTSLPEFNIEQFDERITPVVPSPCQKVCRIDQQHQLCLGCWRTLDEIACWSRADNAQKLAIWRLLKQRNAAAESL